ncbi:sulfur reductase DrsE [Sulfodiicoccus acidiphilus]|uniref:Sulfur reductase DrsE n=1 Tax=Sulfodiicoccus acidiphilus TaxID=1670455 RepID=A0A348B591_9CREN|nr:sulfur reductase DrsE [Sulfodiicoccus acidiphilus]GGT88963.1 sulfur reductase DrsE [Sulfodiicoccus acidiphilus]
MKVVVQVANDPEKGVNSVINLLREMDVGEVEVVFHQDAINAVLDPSLVGRLHPAKVVACRNSLRARGIDESTLPRGTVVVDAGVAEIVRRQAEGWIYLRV